MIYIAVAQLLCLIAIFFCVYYDIRPLLENILKELQRDDR